MTRSALAFEFPLIIDEDDDFRPDPPTREEIDRDYRIEMIIGWFQQAAAGEEHTANALEGDTAQRMLGALALAHAGARRALPSSYSRADRSRARRCCGLDHLLVRERRAEGCAATELSLST